MATIVVPKESLLEVPREVLEARRRAHAPRPATAGEALKLLKRRHPKLKKQTSFIVKGDDNESPMSVTSVDKVFQQHNSQFLKKGGAKQTKQQAQRGVLSDLNNGKENVSCRTTGVKKAQNILINNIKHFERPSSPLPPPPPPPSGSPPASQAFRDRAPTWEEEQAAMFMPQDKLVRVECPHCFRKFAKEASKRHIEVCSNTKSKPKAPPKQVSAYTDRLGVRRGGRGGLSCTANERPESASMAQPLRRTRSQENKNAAANSDPSSANGKVRTEEQQMQRLSRLWGEIMFLLRKPIRTDADFDNCMARTAQGAEFLNQLEKAAGELGVLKGTLSRWLLPFDNKTSVADQAQSSQSEFGSNELDGLLPYGLRRKMVRDATDLRSLIRVKIADDADLLQAKESLRHIMKFGRALVKVARTKNESPSNILKTL